jgi:transposase-like protein
MAPVDQPVDILPDEDAPLRVPRAADGLQVNFCKNPVCKNYGVPAKQGTRTGKGPSKDRDPNYAISGLGRNEPGFKCKGCGEIFPPKSNVAIQAEYQRLGSYLLPYNEPSCKNPACKNHERGVFSYPDEYASFGKTSSGNPRFRCKRCHKTFSYAKTSTHRQREKHKNAQIFRMLVNKTPINRIVEMAEVSPDTVYRKINFIHEQCMAFIGDREGQLKSLDLDRLYLSTDRQVYTVNWSSNRNRRNTQFLGIGTADNTSGYVFPVNINYDPDTSLDEVERVAKEKGEYEGPRDYRDTAHVWTELDYALAQNESFRIANSKKDKKKLREANARIDQLFNELVQIQRRRGFEFNAEELTRILEIAVPEHMVQGKLEDNAQLKHMILESYEDATTRPKIEAIQEVSDGLQLPKFGVQIHNDYTMYAHFGLLKELFDGVEKVRFFLDQDSGMRAAFLGMFSERVRQHTADAWYVKFRKDYTIDEKKRVSKELQQRVNAYLIINPGGTEDDAYLDMAREAVRHAQGLGPWKDVWMRHPLAKYDEPEKMAAALTDTSGMSIDHQAKLLLKASLHGIDQFFMQLRRRMNPLERDIKTAANSGRTWYGYSPYRPDMVQKYIDIFRVYYNYVLKSPKKKTTPAMRLSLARGRVRTDDILGF